jgi:hypothetical protein
MEKIVSLDFGCADPVFGAYRSRLFSPDSSVLRFLHRSFWPLPLTLLWFWLRS